MKATVGRGGDEPLFTLLGGGAWICLGCGMLIYVAACPCLLAQPPADAVIDSASPARTPVDRNIELATRLVPDNNLRVGEPVTFEVSVRWLDLGERLSTRLAEPPSLENFQVVSTSSRSSTHATREGRQVEEVYCFRLIPLEEGPARIGRVEVLYGPRGEEDSSLSSVPRDLAVGPPRRSLGFLPLVPVGCLLVALALVGGWFLLRRRRPQVEVAVQAEPSSPVEGALSEARRWRMEGDIGRYYGCLERAVSQELARRFSYREPMPASSAELPAEVDSETRRFIESFFSRCAEAKYAPGVPPREELDRIWDDANRLLRPPQPFSGKQK